MSDDTRPRFTDGPAYRLQRMEHVIMTGSSLTIPIRRVRVIREARAELAEKREAVAQLRHDRIVHVRQLEEVSGGISLAGGIGGELSPID